MLHVNIFDHLLSVALKSCKLALLAWENRRSQLALITMPGFFSKVFPGGLQPRVWVSLAGVWAINRDRERRRPVALGAGLWEWSIWSPLVLGGLFYVLDQ